MRNMIEIYTDGSCINHVRMGAWAYVKTSHGTILREECGVAPNSGHIRMELMAVLHAVRDMTIGEYATICTDSKYIVDAINDDKLSRWMSADFKTKKGVRVHADIWRELHRELQHKAVVFRFVPSHSGIPFNDHVDRLARRCAREAVENKILFQTRHSEEHLA